ncbi:alcohol dehydrogenase catalytic domain-containing protein, partial [Streptomyces shaanxiensis]
MHGTEMYALVGQEKPGRSPEQADRDTRVRDTVLDFVTGERTRLWPAVSDRPTSGSVGNPPHEPSAHYQEVLDLFENVAHPDDRRTTRNSAPRDEQSKELDMSHPSAGGSPTPGTMPAVVVTRPGGLDALEIKDVPVPVRKPGWVRIRVKAFGVNESEVTTRKGESDAEVTYPRVPGIEGVGVVDEADEDSGLRSGQQVATMMGGMGRSYDGAYAQYLTVPAAQVIPFESGLPWEVVGALPEMFQTAYGSLTTGLDLKARETLLIRGGTST